jgi:electron transfer flavoprotein beta subunit
LPVLVTAQQGLNEPRYPSLPGIMKAKKKPLNRLSTADLAIEASDTAAKSAAVELAPPPNKRDGKVLNGDAKTQATQLIDLLRNEAKVL